MIRTLMSRPWRVLILALALATAPASAGTLPKVPVTLDPSKAYVVVEIGKLDDGVLYGSLVLARYDEGKGDIAEPTPRAEGKAGKNVAVLDNRLYLLKPAVKNGDRRLYVVELDPGLWVVEGANDTAFSLGSSTLRLQAGSVTDLGVVTVYSDFPEGQKRDVLTNGRLLKGALMGGIFGSTIPKSMPKAIDVRSRTSGDIPMPAVLAGLARPVEWAGQVKFGNHLGGLVNRMGGRKARIKAMVAEQNGMAQDAEASEARPAPDLASQAHSVVLSPAP
jgi:hypothetical protein